MHVEISRESIPEGATRVFPLKVPDFINLRLELISDQEILEIRVKNQMTRKGIIEEFNIIYGLGDMRDVIKIDAIIKRMVRDVDHRPKESQKKLILMRKRP